MKNIFYLIKGIFSFITKFKQKNNNKFDETKKWNEFAKEHNLFVTAGSDFHNKDGIRPEIGFVNTDFVLSEDTINEIIRNLSVN